MKGPKKGATIATATVTAIPQSLALITTRPKTIVQGSVIVTCIAVIFRWPSNAATIPKTPTTIATIVTIGTIGTGTKIETIATGAVTGICTASTAARISCGRQRSTPDTTPVLRRAATTAEEEDTAIFQTLALIATLRVITVRVWAIGSFTAATIDRVSRMVMRTAIAVINIQPNR